MLHGVGSENAFILLLEPDPANVDSIVAAMYSGSVKIDAECKDSILKLARQLKVNIEIEPASKPSREEKSSVSRIPKRQEVDQGKEENQRVQAKKAQNKRSIVATPRQQDPPQAKTGRRSSARLQSRDVNVVMTRRRSSIHTQHFSSVIR